MPRIRRSVAIASQAKATAYPETRTDAGTQAISPEQMKAVMFQRPPRQDTWNRTRFGRGLNMDRIESALRGAQYGAMRDITDLAYETMSLDPHLAAVLTKRINAVASLPYDIVAAEGPGVDPAKAEANAELVRTQISRIPNFAQALKQLAWALYHGRSALEIQWLLRPTDQAQKVGGPYKEPKQDWVAAELTWIHPRRLQFGPKRELRVSDEIITTGFQEVGIALSDYPFKFLEFKPQLFGDYPEMEGLAPRCLYWSFFKRFTARDRLILLELFAKPWRIIQFDKDAAAGIDDLRAAEMAVDQLGDTTSARLPRGAELNVVQPGDGAGEIHAEIIAESDKQISKLVLGQTGTTDAQNSGLGSNQPSVMANEQLMILAGDAGLLGDAVEDGLCDAIVALNRGIIELVNAPRFIMRAEMPTDRAKEALRVKGALDAGLEVAVDEAYEVIGFRKPTETDATLRIMDVAGPDGISKPRAIMQPPSKPDGGADGQDGIGNIVAPGDKAPPTAPGGDTPASKGKFSLAPTDLASVVQVNEARASAGLGPLTLPTGAPDPDGNLTVAAFQAKHEIPKPPPFGNAPKPPEGGGGPPKSPGEEPPPKGDNEPPKPPTPKPDEPPTDKAPPADAPKLPEPVSPKAPAPAKPAGNLPAPVRMARGSVESELAEFIADADALSDRFEAQLCDAMRGTIVACTHEHAHSVILDKSVQPSTVNGTLEDLISKGVKEASRVTSKWVDAYVSAVKSARTPAAINKAIIRTHAALELNQYARIVERRVSHATMTGALDSQWEGETDDQIKPEAFPAPETKASRVGLANQDLTKAEPTAEVVEVTSEPEFTTYSYQAALKYFNSKAPIPKSTFAKLSASMKARSFTVAGLASDASLETAKSELANAIVEGSDLKEFSTRLAARFESAGMTALNPSHAENVFRTNILDTYNIGRRAEMSQPDVLKMRPYWLIRTVNDSRQRKTHGAVSNWVLRADDSFWAKGGPPWGYQCRCRVTSIREPRAKEMGIRSGAEIRGLPDDGFTPNALVSSSLADLLSP